MLLSQNRLSDQKMLYQKMRDRNYVQVFLVPLILIKNVCFLRISSVFVEKKILPTLSETWFGRNKAAKRFKYLSTRNSHTRLEHFSISEFLILCSKLRAPHLVLMIHEMQTKSACWWLWRLIFTGTALSRLTVTRVIITVDQEDHSASFRLWECIVFSRLLVFDL